MPVVGYVTEPEYQCAGKRTYARKKDAKTAARHAEQRIGRMEPYRCPHCDRWHLGHRPKGRPS